VCVCGGGGGDGGKEGGGDGVEGKKKERERELGTARRGVNICFTLTLLLAQRTSNFTFPSLQAQRMEARGKRRRDAPASRIH
jgi:hypothetical protein